VPATRQSLRELQSRRRAIERGTRVDEPEFGLSYSQPSTTIPAARADGFPRWRRAPLACRHLQERAVHGTFLLGDTGLHRPRRAKSLFPPVETSSAKRCDAAVAARVIDHAKTFARSAHAAGAKAIKLIQERVVPDAQQDQRAFLRLG